MFLLAASAVAQGAGFAYQGRLNDDNRPASGRYDLTFSLYGESVGGLRLRGPESHSNVLVSNGLFTVTLDFGDKSFDGTAYWLEMAARTNGESGFTTLSQRRQLFPAPYAIFSTTAGEARAVAASNILGVLSVAQLPPPQGNGAGLTNLPASKLIGSAPSATNFTGALVGDVTGRQSATVVSSVGGVSALLVSQGADAANAATSVNTASAIVRRNVGGGFAAGTILGSFVGPGSGLTLLSGDAVATGTVADARLSSNVALLGRDQTFTGSNRFSGAVQLTNAANRLAGTFVGDGSGLTNLSVGPSIGTNTIVAGFSGPLVGDVTGSQGATVVSTVGGVSAANVAVGVTTAFTATEANVGRAVVKRDPGGGFAAGTILGSFVGIGSGLTLLSGDAVATGTVADARLSSNVALLGRDQTFTGSNRFSGAVQLTNAANRLNGTFAGDGAALTNLAATAIVGTAPSATNFTGPLLGDVTGTRVATVVSTVGGVTAANVAAGATLANAATEANASSTVVKRDASGGFAAGTMRGSFVGNGSGLTNLTAAALVGVVSSAANLTGPLLGDVIGLQGATVVSAVGGVSAANVASGVGAANTATSANTASAIVRRDASGGFAAGTITGSFVGTGSGLTNLSGDAVAAGTVADARLSSNVALLGRDQTFTGAVQLTNASNRLVGTFVGDGAGLTNLSVGSSIGTNTIVAGFSGPLVGDVTGSQGATVVSTVGGVTAANVAAGATLANAATEANAASTVVKRDASGGFAAGTITGSFVGAGSGLTQISGDAVATGTVADARLSSNVALLGRDQTFTGSNRFSGAVQLTNAANRLVGTFVGDGAGLTNLSATAYVGTNVIATGFSGSLAGDVTGSQGATVVSTVGGVTAANVAAGAALANAATNANTPHAIVRRDASGDIIAGRISGAFVGDGALLTNVNAGLLVGSAPSATNFTGLLLGDVTGSQGGTAVSAVGGVPAASVASGANRGNAATPTNILGAIVRRDPCDASFVAGTITARFVGDGSGLTNLPTTPPYYAAPAGAVLVSLFSPDAALVAGGYRQFMSTTVPAWVNGSTSNAPSARSGHSTVWSGQAMIAWGGTASGSTYLSSGAMYDPSADSWSTVSSVGAPTARTGHTAVWADTQMIVWGGLGSSGNLGTGARYNPSANTWSAVAASGAPAARMGHVSVWTSSKMVVWGGINNSGLLSDGAVYDPALNQWSTISLTNAPEGRMNAVAVWAGDRMIVWGGTGASGELNTGGQLIFTNGVPAQWLATTTSNAPYARIGHTAVWASDRMIIWGGQSGGVPLDDGGVYCASCDEWKGVSATNAPLPRYDHAVVWTGTEMLIAGGANVAGGLSTSAGYDPSTQQWRPLSNVGGPLARSLLGAAWSGTEILVFGGNSGSQTVASLQRLSPQPAWYFYRKL